MLVKDIELLKDISIIFEKGIIIYGAGVYGRKALDLLCNVFANEARERIRGFCESDSNAWKQRMGIDSIKGFKVFSVEEVKEYLQNEDYMIIVAAKPENVNAIINENLLSCSCFYTHAALQWAIELNIYDKRIDENYRQNFIRGKHIYQKKFWQRYLWGRMDEILRYNPVIVCTPGKVGSLSVFHSIKQYCPAIHIHEVCETDDLRIADLAENRSMFQYYKAALKKIEKIKIVTLVRDPIARQISKYFQPLRVEEAYIYENDIINDTDEGIRNALYKGMKDGIYGEEFEWFNKQIKRVFDLDIFDYDFDREKGYAIIKERNIECLVLTMEMLNQNINVIGEFVGVPNLEMVRTNIGNEKAYAYIYREAKANVDIPQDILEFYYHDNIAMNHFYSREQKEVFVKTWMK